MKQFFVTIFFILNINLIAQNLKEVPGTYIYWEHATQSIQIVVIDANLTFWFSDGKKNFVPLKTIQADWKKKHLMLQFPHSKEIYHIDYEFEPIKSFEWINPDKSIQSFFYKDSENNPQNVKFHEWKNKITQEK
jgi:hypothetical protein